MSLYNTLFGSNPASPLLLGSLGLVSGFPEDFEEKLKEISNNWGDTDWECEKGQELLKEAKESKYYPVGRFRDIFYQKDEDGQTKIVLYTRNGGGNREAYGYVFDLLSEHPLYIQDYDDDFDSTYAYIEFKSTELVDEFFKGVEAKSFESVGDKFKKEIERMENGGEPNEQVMGFMKSIVETLNKEVDNA